ncbi:hypothetical protein [Hyphococcus luteus]|uniref:BPP domain-containing protein n=1 Tax=Hyphococcus luteus TaxID=2058213 RepID=A0A2S7JZ42_9PROT|nr:hypothetical protein [Marinicaulis flavus]PQA85521.1 hypothetical protein CW354_21515 [Marinicaulis flavus]
MRLAAPLLAGLLLFAAACEREASPPGEAPQEAPSVTAPVSDELPGLPAPATGIAFWDHPTLSFNGLMIVATEDGVLSYSMEDGTEVSRIDGFNADGVATGYLGLGDAAAGFIAFLDGDENTFRFYGVDNQSRAFLPLEAGPAIRGAVRGFCLGRGLGVAAPSLFVIQKDKIQVFNLAASESGVAVDSQTEIAAPDNLVSCAVDLDGALLAAADTGDIYRLAGDNSFAAPFAKGPADRTGDLSVVPAAGEEDASGITGHLFLAGLAQGEVHVFDRETGAALGSVRLIETSSLPAVGEAEVFGATGANLGALYRNGVIAFGVAETEDGPAIRIAPASTVKNALSLPLGEPVSPRGEAPTTEDGGLIIPANFDQQ